MAMAEGLGAMLGKKAAEEGAKEGLSYAPYIGWAYKGFKAFEGYKKGGIKGALKTLVPFGGSIFGGGSSRSDEMTKQYMALVNKFESEFIQPTMQNLNQAKHRANIGAMRVGSESVRSIMRQFEGASEGLRKMVRSEDFGSITGRMSELSDLSSKLQKAFGGRGGGPSRTSIADVGTQKLPTLKLNESVPAINLPTRDIGFGGTFDTIRSESHRFPVTTTRTPGESASGRLANILKSKPYSSPGILT